MRLRAKENGY